MSWSAYGAEVSIRDASDWTTLAFRKIPVNTVRFSDDGLHIGVDKSASPLVHKLDVPLTIRGIHIEASWRGALTVPDGAVQGDKGADDFVLKAGLIESGSQTLNWLQRRMAAQWIKTLFKLAPIGRGVERIHFLSTTQDAALVGSSRTHPLSDLLFESRITPLTEPGRFEMHQTFDEPVEILGLWLSVDGDDTGSEFDVQIHSIRLLTDADIDIETDSDRNTNTNTNTDTDTDTDTYTDTDTDTDTDLDS